MKRFLLILLSLFSVTTIFSQEISILDSTVSYYFLTPSDSMLQGRTVYGYDSLGNRLTKASYSWNAAQGSWRGSSMNENRYDEAGNLTEMIASIWDREIGNWINYTKQSNTFDDKGTLTNRLSQEWDPESEAWITVERITQYMLSTNGIIFRELISRWDPATGILVSKIKNETEYEPDGMPVIYTEFDWDSEALQWIADRIINYFYDDPKGLTEQVIRTKNIQDDSWHYTARSLIEHDEQNRPVSYIQYTRNEQNNVWVNDNRFDINYDRNGNRTEMTSYLWDSNEGAYYGTNRYVNEYDERGNNTSGEIFLWDRSLDDWSLRVRYAYLFDERGDIGTQLLYLADASTGNLNIMKKDHYFYSMITLPEITDTTIIDPNDTITTDTTEITDITTGLSGEKIRIYPNPVSDILHIDSPQPLIAEIYELSGRNILSTRAKTIDVSSYKSGMYVIRFLNERREVVKFERVMIY